MIQPRRLCRPMNPFKVSIKRKWMKTTDERFFIPIYIAWYAAIVYVLSFSQTFKLREVQLSREILEIEALDIRK